MDNDLTGWFAVRTMYRNDLNVGRYLEAQGAEVFIPMHYVDVKRGGAVRQVLEPVVRNIVFTRTCRSLLDRVKKELESKWAIRLFMNRETHEPILIPEEQMRSFIAVSGTYDQAVLYLEPTELNLSQGTRVRITGGIFEGVEGVFVRVRHDRRVVVNIEGVMAVATTFVHASLVEEIGDKYSN